MYHIDLYLSLLDSFKGVKGLIVLHLINQSVFFAIFHHIEIVNSIIVDRIILFSIYLFFKNRSTV